MQEWSILCRVLSIFYLIWENFGSWFKKRNSEVLVLKSDFLLRKRDLGLKLIWQKQTRDLNTDPGDL